LSTLWWTTRERSKSPTRSGEMDAPVRSRYVISRGCVLRSARRRVERQVGPRRARSASERGRTACEEQRPVVPLVVARPEALELLDEEGRLPHALVDVARVPERVRGPNDDAAPGRVLELERDEQSDVARRPGEAGGAPRRLARRACGVGRARADLLLLLGELLGLVGGVGGRGALLRLGVVGGGRRVLRVERRVVEGEVVEGEVVEADAALADLVEDRVLVRDEEAVRLVAVPDKRRVAVREREGRQVLGEAVDFLQAGDVGVVVEDSARGRSAWAGEADDVKKEVTHCSMRAGRRSLPCRRDRGVSTVSRKRTRRKEGKRTLRQSLPGKSSRPAGSRISTSLPEADEARRETRGRGPERASAEQEEGSVSEPP